MKKTRFCIFFIIIPAIVSIGYYFLHNKETSKMIEIDVSSLIIALVTGFLTLLGILFTEIFGWKKASEKMNKISDDVGVDKNRVCLSQQHENMEKSILEKNENLMAFLEKEIRGTNLNAKVDDVHKALTEYKTNREAHLSEFANEQKDIKKEAERFSLFLEDWEKAIIENKQLRSEIEVVTSSPACRGGGFLLRKQAVGSRSIVPMY